MLEQSTLHGRIYHSVQKGKTLASKPVPISQIRFGPKRLVEICRVSDTEMWVQDKRQGDWYHYRAKDRESELLLVERIGAGTMQGQERPQGQGRCYYYGKAALHDAKHTKGDACPQEELYFTQNEPAVTWDGVPDVRAMPMPLSMQALDYDQVFRYPGTIRELLKGLPACYVDRYKRPIQRIRGLVYPIAMEKVSTSWADLPESTYPVVLDFKGSPFAVADLEPERTEEDEQEFQSLPGYYEEETPRGGKHKLIHLEDTTFKFRFSKGLEVISQSQVTLYGINARWLSDSPGVPDLSSYGTVGHKEHAVHAAMERPDVSEEVRILKAKAEENLSAASEVASRLYRTDPDESHGEFVALQALYWQDIRPYAKQFEPGLLPWIVEGYAKGIIPHRDKHETARRGLPYLVYLAAIIIGKEAKIWKSPKCTSSGPGP